MLIARLCHRPCPACGEDVPPASEAAGDPWEEDEYCPEEGEIIPCPRCGEQLPALSMTSFSFNKPAGACPTCTGLGVVADLLERTGSLLSTLLAGLLSILMHISPV